MRPAAALLLFTLTVAYSLHAQETLHVTLEENLHEPLAVVVLMQTGGTASRHSGFALRSLFALEYR